MPRSRLCPAARILAAQLEVALAFARYARTRSHRAWDALVWARQREMDLQ